MLKLLMLSTLAVFVTAAIAKADAISDHNKVYSPPMYSSSETDCSAELLFKSVAIPGVEVEVGNHAYLVVSGSDGSKLEIRGGTEKRGPVGNPQSCPDTTHPWGVVVGYVGKHGKLADGEYSPDGNVVSPTGRVSLGAGAQTNVCKMANCVMTVVKALGASCKNYVLGVAKIRNSNTMVSQALASCGVPDSRPAGLTAAGWGDSWE